MTSTTTCMRRIGSVLTVRICPEVGLHRHIELALGSWTNIREIKYDSGNRRRNDVDGVIGRKERESREKMRRSGEAEVSMS